MRKAKFTFQPIGQGGFYTGEIHNNSCKFNFVYDCGSSSKRDYLNDSIEFYKDSLNGRKLDVLFISHLDDDHVNGIVKLLDGIQCERVYMPYLTPINRLIVALRHSPSELASNGYNDFLISPDKYLLNQKSKIIEIVYLDGNTESEFESNAIEGGEDFEDNLKETESPSTNIDEFDPKVKFKMGNGAILFSNIWEFYLYNEPASEGDRKRFLDGLNRIYNSNFGNELSQDDLKGILSNKSKLAELRKEFRKTFNNINKTGLVVLHKPLAYNYSDFRKANFSNTNLHHCFSHNWYGNRMFHLRKNTHNNIFDWGFTMLTGDIALSQIENSIYIKDNLKNVLVFQVPHHGSKNGWDNAFLKKLNTKCNTAAVINFGYGNTYGHPKPKVLEGLNENNFDICFCNQFEYLEYEFIFDFSTKRNAMIKFDI